MGKLSKLLTLLVITLLSTSMMTLTTSCSSNNDNEIVEKQTYGTYFSATSNLGTEELYGVILNPIAKKLNMSKYSTPFTLEGKKEDCDAKVKKACEEITKEVADYDFKGTYTIKIFRDNNTIFENTFKKK